MSMTIIIMFLRSRIVPAHGHFT